MYATALDNTSIAGRMTAWSRREVPMQRPCSVTKYSDAVLTPQVANVPTLVRDHKGRPVQYISIEGQYRPYYMGIDAQGFIREDQEGEYILVGTEKRYWRGVIPPVPHSLQATWLDSLGVVVLKPDADERGLRETIITEVGALGFGIVTHRQFQFSAELVYRMYPYFFTREWECQLVTYLTRGVSHFYLVRGNNATLRLLELRKRIRRRYCSKHEHPVVNVMHCPDSVEESLREAHLFLGRKTISALCRSTL